MVRQGWEAKGEMKSSSVHFGIAGLLLVLLFELALAGTPTMVRPGIEVLLSDSLGALAGRRLGLVTNQTGIDRQGRSTIERLSAEPSAKLVRLFAPEHGIDGSRPAGEIIENEIHAGTGLFVSSLYRGKRHVDVDLFDGIDLVLFDIQDIGVRPYTFVSTLAEVMKTGKEADVEVMVLDRPNPLGGRTVSGFTLDPDFASFIGPYPVPYVHGMTVAELARLFNEEFGIGCRLRVIPLSGWKRGMDFGATGLPWVPTSPNVPTWETARALAISGALGELGTASVGVGTPSPFWVLGRPGLDGNALVGDLRRRNLPGVAWLPWRWRPDRGPFAEQICSGARLLVLDGKTFDPGRAQIALSLAMQAVAGPTLFDAHADRIRMFDKAMGSDRLRLALLGGSDGAGLEALMEQEDRAFRRLRAPYLLYPEER